MVLSKIQKIREWISRRPRPVILFSVSLVINCAIGLILYLVHGSHFITLGDDDSFGYLSLGRSVAAGNGFVLDGIVSALRPPLYSVYLAFFIFFQMPVEWAIVGQYAFASFSVVLMYRIGRSVYSRAAGIFAATLFMIEPYVLMLNSTAMTETLFIFLSLAGVYSVLRLLETGGTRKWSVYAGVFFGLATLTRPTMLYVPGIILIILILGRKYSEKIRGKISQSFIFFLFAFCLILLPWSIREYVQFGSIRPSSVDTYLLYWRVLPIAVAHEKGITYAEAIDFLKQETPQKIFQFDALKMQHTFEYDHILKQEIVAGVSRQLPAIANFYISSLPVTMVSTGYPRILEKFGIAESSQDNVTLLLSKYEYGALARALLNPSPFQILRLFGALLWLFIFVTILYNIRILFVKERRMGTLVLFIFIAFFTLFAIGPQVYVRYQLVTYPYWFLLFAAAVKLPKKR